MGKTLNDFYNDLGARESGGNYAATNKQGYIGKYQMGEAAMIDAGYYKKSSGKYNNDWTGEFTGKDGVHSKADFLRNKQAQENAQKAFKQKQWSYMTNFAGKYAGKTIGGFEVTESSMLAGAHLCGQGAVQQYLESGGKIDKADGNGVKVSDYMKKFAGYDVSEITKTTPQKTESTSSKPNDYNPDDLYRGMKQRIDKTGNVIQRDNVLTGGATPFTVEQIGKMSKEEFEQNENAIMEQLRKGQIKSEADNKNYSNYSNPATGSGKIYSREDIGAMSTKEYQAVEKEINAQMNSIGIPTKAELQNASESGGGTVYVQPYTRADGTQVKGYYRSK